ncbi:MAG TPA: polyhydroxyalkanoic acid system family protein [Thermoanaerobaculia bacterium]|nr:polyhydroxyalkanoic acid system family protein [Thermoanaerobaculia bacterium]
MRIAVPHNLTKDEARRRVDQKLSTLLGQFGHQAEHMEHDWAGDTLRFKGKAKGMSVQGTVEITDAAMIVDAKLPLIATMFEGKIREAVQKEADTLFRA